MSKSVVTFVRKQLNVKGRSVHNGRGMFECTVVGLTQAEVLTKVREKLVVWQQQGIVEKTDEDENGLAIFFKKSEKFDEYYRLLVVAKESSYFTGFGICMTM